MSDSTYATRTEKNRDKWRVLIAEWENSRLSQVRFCQKNNLDKVQFAYYRRALGATKIAKILPIPSTQSLTRRALILSATFFLYARMFHEKQIQAHHTR
jgi:hypothetical protein